MTYSPLPGSIPARVVAYLQDQARAGRFWIPGVEIEDHLDQTPIGAYLERPVTAGLIRKRHMEADRRRCEYAVGDGRPLPPRPRDKDEPLETRPAPAKPIVPAWPPTTPPEGTTPMASKPKKPPAGMSYANIESMAITDDPITPRTSLAGEKYAPLFARMRLGQAIKCTPDDAPRVANAMRKWARESHPGAVVRAVRHYPADNMGRVWLLDAKGARS